MGSLAVENRVPKTSAAAVERLIEAGAIVLGKTNTPEFGHKGITDNLRFGPTSTPWKIGYNSGGSSGGSAAAVADGMAALGAGHRRRRLGPDPGLLQRRRRIQAFLWPSPIRDSPRRFPVGPSARAYRAPRAHSRRRRADDIGHGWAACGRPADTARRWRRLLARRGRRATTFRVAFSPQLGDFPVDRRVAGVVKSAVDVLARSGIEVDEVELDFGADHDTLARLWVRVISVHYGAIARHWKQEGVDLLGEHAEKLTPQFRQMLIDARQFQRSTMRSTTCCGLEFLSACRPSSSATTSSCPRRWPSLPVRNASDGNTIGPADIGGETVDPLIGWCMTYPINFTGHPAISVPAGLTPEGLPVGLQIIGRRHADEAVLALASRFELAQPWFQNYPGLDLTGRVTGSRELRARSD